MNRKERLIFFVKKLFDIPEFPKDKYKIDGPYEPKEAVAGKGVCNLDFYKKGKLVARLHIVEGRPIIQEFYYHIKGHHKLNECIMKVFFDNDMRFATKPFD